MVPVLHLAKLPGDTKTNLCCPAGDHDNFLLSMDVHQFTPQELTVKIKKDCLTVEGKHEERHDGHGFISRSVIRRVLVPEGIDDRRITCNVTSDGVLEIFVPKVPEIEDKTVERVLHVHYTAKLAHISDETTDTAPTENKHFHQDNIPDPQAG